jgi:predicted phosphodiesterase
MKIVALGDTHGRSIWKEITAKEENADKIILIGDYFDTHGGGYSGNRQIENFKDILEYKKANMDKVVLLFGNHDFHYIRNIGENYSGFQASYAHDIGDVIHAAMDADLVQMCFVHDKYVFTHAGVTKTWCMENEIDTSNLAQSINDLFKFKPNRFKFTPGVNWDNYGDDITQTPIWVRPASLGSDKLDGVVYVVGHTTVKALDVSKADTFNLIMIDTLGESQEYLVIEDGIPKSVK